MEFWTWRPFQKQTPTNLRREDLPNLFCYSFFGMIVIFPLARPANPSRPIDRSQWEVKPSVGDAA
ncbi:hypothetical protein BDV27DRAFT_127575 [Aspergillus caelatus]|uniref:Uncharacterized protein n=1 Tax=Aspergillus caelatus TaxID=61420 RepID=A0A5N7A6H0_9EURO|nr:uncharacterized protein BDV27DRAFT_127575 [Aspergillus caelatus]KAE8365028.1 hypothetical protein BDV27DRAFT_127575 [Aspergillus caelatus]